MWSNKFETSVAKLIATVICGTGLISVPAIAQTQLINNGGFESGLAGWTVFDQAGGSGSFFAATGTGSPGGGAGGAGCVPTVGPKTGTFYAGSAQSGPGAHALLQTFTVSPAAVGARKIVLEFDMFINDCDGGFINPAGLDYTAVPNEHGRVDLLSATGTPLTTTVGVLRNFYIGNDGLTSASRPYIHYTFDISNNVGAGGTFQIRFAEVDNQNFFTQGVDNVSILVTDLNVFQVRYASNLTGGDSVINLTNTGANGASLNGPGFGGAAGNICVNVYAFSPDEQLVSCCSCLITPNGLASLSVNSDLISNTLTGVRPNSVVVKLVNTGAGDRFTGTSCTNSAAVAGTAAFPLAAGMLGFGTTIHAAPVAGTFGVTETPFLSATLSTQELASITNRCANIIGNGSTFGICRSCRVGGLASDR